MNFLLEFFLMNVVFALVPVVIIMIVWRKLKHQKIPRNVAFFSGIIIIFAAVELLFFRFVPETDCGWTQHTGYCFCKGIMVENRCIGLQYYAFIDYF